MTVEELLEKLKDCHPQAPVFVQVRTIDAPGGLAYRLEEFELAEVEEIHAERGIVWINFEDGVDKAEFPELGDE